MGLRPGHLTALLVAAAGAYATWAYVGLGWAPWATGAAVVMIAGFVALAWVPVAALGPHALLVAKHWR